MKRIRTSLVRCVVAVLAAMSGVAGVAAASGKTTPKRAPTAQQVARACHSTVSALNDPPAAAAVPGSVAASVLAPYAALRRPQQPSDSPPSLGDEPSLSEQMSGLRSYDPADTRLVASLAATRVFLVAGLARTLRVAASCARLAPELSALAKIEADTVGTGPAYCLLAVSSVSGGADTSCAGFSVDVGFASDQVGLADGTSDSIELVPDGVGAVQDHVKAEPLSAAPVTNNIAIEPVQRESTKLRAELRAALRKPRLLPAVLNQVLPTSVTWLTAPGGAVIRTLPRPPHLLADTVAGLKFATSLLSGGGTTTTCSGSTSAGHTKQRCTTSTD